LIAGFASDAAAHGSVSARLIYFQSGFGPVKNQQAGG
jgi:hypothetical protein